MICFIILHYTGIHDTFKCITAIQRIPLREYRIIVVDNASPDNSAVLLKQQFETDESIYIIENGVNLGFSVGNNVGCKFAIENFNPEFLCVMNNDSILLSPQFEDILFQTFTESNFDVLGPRIVTSKGFVDQNPRSVITTVDEVREDLKEIRIGELILRSPFPFLYYFYNRFFRKNRHNNLGLHGAVLIFSRKYYERFSEVFPEITFLYAEEDLLYFRKIKSSLSFVFQPRILVEHNHSASTRSINKGVISLWKFQSKHMLNAKKSLLEVYERDIEI